ncbi:glutamyl-tRNA reductase [Robiginitalea sp. M366]|uniref:glutamyl-tRNA reductase n=1 Tax=Robiginitalea aestuariiviva TaxID=3036903 RepID=UPI00240E1229|nr:glutamyl-tRNA reductase [Robiginitalea aestuariiviva]MDG1571381.1 glutamyl-tRNA reductase [Robiginitalea aestuariiviva]
MKKYHISKHNRFITVGLNYEKADVETRGRFALLPEAEAALLEQARQEGIDGLLVTSTCNRTELHGFAAAPQHLIRLLCQHSQGCEAEFDAVGYVYENQDAISHLFRVGSGLDSQILGDFEIISQLKKAFVNAREKGITNPFLERLTNAVIQASKRIKNETGLSSGATSVAFASVQYLLARVPEISGKKILLFGTGKIGRNTCENLVKHTGHDHITLINRTLERAEALGQKLHLEVKPIEILEAEVDQADVIVVATGAAAPTLTASMIRPGKPRWVLDLSVPANVAPEVGAVEGTTVVDLDQLSRITDQTLRQREQFIPDAENIIREVHADFNQWLESRRFAPVLRALKRKLQTMKDEELDFQSRKMTGFDMEQADVVTDRIINKITRQFANQLKDSETDTDEYMELISRVFQLETDRT